MIDVLSRVILLVLGGVFAHLAYIAGEPLTMLLLGALALVAALLAFEDTLLF